MKPIKRIKSIERIKSIKRVKSTADDADTFFCINCGLVKDTAERSDVDMDWCKECADET